MAKTRLPDKEYVWSPELAYAVGLLVTDGCLSNDGRHIIFRSCDIDQIEALRLCLHIQTTIESPRYEVEHGQRVCYRLQIGDVQLYRWLLRIGLFPKKSYTIGPIAVPDEFFRDFLRGHLDGDGMIVTYRDSYNVFKNSAYIYTRLFVRFISASEHHMVWMRSVITRLLQIKGDLSSSRGPKSTVPLWSLKFMKRESIKLLDWIYYDPYIPYLERKRKKAEGALNAIKKINRKPYTKKISTQTTF